LATKKDFAAKPKICLLFLFFESFGTQNRTLEIQYYRAIILNETKTATNSIFHDIKIS
jgi:hypothetical protein